MLQQTARSATLSKLPQAVRWWEIWLSSWCKTTWTKTLLWRKPSPCPSPHQSLNSFRDILASPPHGLSPPQPQPGSHQVKPALPPPRPKSPSSAENAVRALNNLEAQLLPLDYLKSVARGIEKPFGARIPLMDVSQRNAVSRVLSASRSIDLVALASSTSPDGVGKNTKAEGSFQARKCRVIQGQEPGSSYFANPEGHQLQGNTWGRMTDTVRASMGNHDNDVTDEPIAEGRRTRVSLADLGSLAHGQQ